MSDEPVLIETDRLILLPHETSDFADVYALWSDEAVTRHIYDRPQTETEAWFRLLRYRGHWSLVGYGYWAVIERDTGRFMGDIGLANYKRAPMARLEDMPEAGWVMARHAHGRGFALEAMKAALAWCDRHIEAPCSWATIMSENHASLRLAEKLGFYTVETERIGDKTRAIVERSRVSKAC